MIVLTSQEKNNYNSYLYALRTTQGKPFSPRKDFAKFDEKDSYHLRRITTMLNKYPHIKPEMYFKAPFMLYKDKTFFGLDYFAGMAAVKSFTVYMKKIQEQEPDSDDQMKFIQESLKYIGAFCIKNKITVEEYPKHKTGITFDWMKHVKTHQVSIYSLMEFDDIQDTMREVAEDEKELFLGPIGKSFYTYKDRYVRSKDAKYLVTQGLNKIRKIIR